MAGLTEKVGKWMIGFRKKKQKMGGTLYLFIKNDTRLRRAARTVMSGGAGGPGCSTTGVCAEAEPQDGTWKR